LTVNQIHKVFGQSAFSSECGSYNSQKLKVPKLLLQQLVLVSSALELEMKERRKQRGRAHF